MLIRIVFSLAVFTLLVSCVTGTKLTTMPVGKNEEVPGLFTVLFFGRHYVESADAISVLDLEGDAYYFIPLQKPKDFEVLKSVSTREAFYESEFFFRLHEAYSGKKKLFRILDPSGKTIGYEIRPLYIKEYYGLEDVVESSYFLQKGGKIVFKATRLSLAELMLKKK